MTSTGSAVGPAADPNAPPFGCTNPAHAHATDAEREDCELRRVERAAHERMASGRPAAARPPTRIGAIVRPLVDLAARGESPPERLLLDALSRVTSRVEPPGVLVEPQREIATPRALYRADVALTLRALPTARIVVEVDGFAYHDGDRERAAEDKRRDRALVRAGWRVLRFAAREVNAAPMVCADEAVETLLAVAYAPPKGAR